MPTQKEDQQSMESAFVTVKVVCDLLCVSRGSGYAIMRRLNTELEQNNKMV